MCSVDKANVLESTELWREVVNEVSKKYPEVELTHMYVDNASMQLVRDPNQFDVIVTTNMFGDILSDCASMLTGSLGMLPSASMGKNETGKCNAMYEPVHGSAPDITGKNIANPLAMILSLAMMFEYTFLRKDISLLINKAVNKILEKGYRTKDIFTNNNKLVSTMEMGDLILKELTNEKFNVAVVGATGNVGREILNIIDNRKFPLKNLIALASEKSNGHSLSYGSDKEVKVHCLEGFNFKEIDLVLSSVVPRFLKFAEGTIAIVIDNTSFFRMKKDIPLIVLRLILMTCQNLEKNYRQSQLFHNSNGTTLKPIHDLFNIKKIVVSTQSLLDRKRLQMDELFYQTLDVYKNKPLMPNFSKEIAFNLIPQIDSFLEDGSTKEEKND